MTAAWHAPSFRRNRRRTPRGSARKTSCAMWGHNVEGNFTNIATARRLHTACACVTKARSTHVPGYTQGHSGGGPRLATEGRPTQTPRLVKGCARKCHFRLRTLKSSVCFECVLTAATRPGGNLHTRGPRSGGRVTWGQQLGSSRPHTDNETHPRVAEDLRDPGGQTHRDTPPLRADSLERGESSQETANESRCLRESAVAQPLAGRAAGDSSRGGPPRSA